MVAIQIILTQLELILFSYRLRKRLNCTSLELKLPMLDFIMVYAVFWENSFLWLVLVNVQDSFSFLHYFNSNTVDFPFQFGSILHYFFVVENIFFIP